VWSPIGPHQSPILTRLLRLHVALSNFAMADVVAARVMLEHWVELSSQRCGPRGIGGNLVEYQIP
jgi:hypothetical protein